MIVLGNEEETMGLTIGVGTGLGPLRIGYWFHPLRHRGGLITGLFGLFFWVIKASIGVAILELWALAWATIWFGRLCYWAFQGLATVVHRYGDRASR
jgi:hypothetical protein